MGSASSRRHCSAVEWALTCELPPCRITGGLSEQAFLQELHVLTLNSSKNCWAKAQTQHQHLWTPSPPDWLCTSAPPTLPGETGKNGNILSLCREKSGTPGFSPWRMCPVWGGPESPRALRIPAALKRGSFLSFLQIIIKNPNKPGTQCFSSETRPTGRKSLKMSFKAAAQSHPMQSNAHGKKQP